jgi:hypothetical protein
MISEIFPTACGYDYILSKMEQMGHYKRGFTVFHLMENETNETVEIGLF